MLGLPHAHNIHRRGILSTSEVETKAQEVRQCALRSWLDAEKIHRPPSLEAHPNPTMHLLCGGHLEHMGRELPVLPEMQSGFLSIAPRGGSHHLLGDQLCRGMCLQLPLRNGTGMSLLQKRGQRVKGAQERDRRGWHYQAPPRAQSQNPEGWVILSVTT